MDKGSDTKKILKGETHFTTYQTMDNRPDDDRHVSSRRDKTNSGFTHNDEEDEDDDDDEVKSEGYKYRHSDWNSACQDAKKTFQESTRPDDLGDRSQFTKPTYSNRKTVSQGAMDFALLMSNLAQLVVLLDVKGKDNTFVIKLLTVLTVLSIILQAVVAVLLTILAQMKVRNETQLSRAERINEATAVLILIVSITNVVNSSMQIERNGSAVDKRQSSQPVDVIVTNDTNLLKQFGRKVVGMQP